MQSKLNQLEKQLGWIHIEDLNRLHLESPNSFYEDILSKFLLRYSDSFHISDSIGELKDRLVHNLLRKLDLITSSEKESNQNSPSSLNNLIYLICETLRICLRETISLTKIQNENFLLSISFILSRPLVYNINTLISSIRCLLNALNNNIDRMNVLISVGCLEPLISILLGNVLDYFPNPKIHPGITLEDTGLLKDYMNSYESFNQLLNYAIKIIFMMSCQCDEVREKLQNEKVLLLSLIYRLSRCFVCNIDPSISYLYFSNILPPPPQCDDQDFKPSSGLTRNNSNPINSNESLYPNLLDITSFPYSNSNSTLFNMILKLLYSLDVYTKLEKYYTWKSEVFIEGNIDVLLFFRHEYYRLKELPNYYKKFLTVPVPASPLNSSIKKLSINDKEVSFKEELMIDDVKINIYSESNIPSIAKEKSFHLDSQSKYENNDSIDSKNQTKDFPNEEILFDNSNITKLLFENYNDDILSYIDKLTQKYNLDALNLLNLLLLIPLTLAPQCSGILYDDSMNQIFYTGKLSECEDLALQLIMTSNDSSLKLLFKNEENNEDLDSNNLQLTDFDDPKFCKNLISLLTSYSSPFLSNSLTRILSRTLIKANHLEHSEKSALLLPIIISISKIINLSPFHFKIVKKFVFPSPFNKVQHNINNNSKKSIDPTDAPSNTLRGELIKLIISIDSNVKRCVSELIFKLCNSDSDEYVYRTGFGNAVALLQMKGLI